MTSPKLFVKVKGHLQIKEKSTNKILLEKSNAIHAKNMATAIARGLVNKQGGFIKSMKLGNGGTIYDAVNGTTFKSPNVFNPNSSLYNMTHEEVFEYPSSETSGNYITFQEGQDIFPVIVCVVQITSSEPSGQLPESANLAGNENNEFAFDELGLFTADILRLDGSIEPGKMLTHVIFPPRLKVEGKDIILTYTLTVITSDEVDSY